jgi:hypothetical protein
MTKSFSARSFINQPIWKLWIGYTAMIMLAYTLAFGTVILSYTETMIPLIRKAAIYGSAFTIAHIICRGVWLKYQSKFIVAVLIAGAVPMGVIWNLPNVGQQTNREVVLGHIGLSTIVVVSCVFLLLSRWVFLKIFRNKSI